MTHDEKRFIRRELINHYLNVYKFMPALKQSDIKQYVRYDEKYLYGYELQAYKESK